MTDLMLPCTECGWFGDRSELTVADGVEHCPKCGREHKLEPALMSMEMVEVEMRKNDDGSTTWILPPGCE